MADFDTSQVEQKMRLASEAAAIFEQYTQEQVDRIIETVYKKIIENRVKLANMAYEETGIGKLSDKIVKMYWLQ